MRVFKCFTVFSGLSLLLLSSCGLQEQRDKLKQEAIVLRQKEQELMLRKQELDAREQILNERQKKMDSVLVGKDTLSTIYPAIPGRWLVKMVCTEATCPGSALGDTKVEQWAITFQNNMVVVKAMNNKFQLTRIYTGSITADGQLSLKAQAPEDSLSIAQYAQITIQLKQTKNDVMQGQRDIIQPEGCHITYTLDLKKQN
ncbi:MAG TPA: hypothetical protein VFL76_10905 [Edaphocola sp.]|nr:hypothetical protein [Edaphocola sp.]